jgi:uncharacterized protein
MKKLILVFALLPTLAFAQKKMDPAKEKDIRHLLELTGAATLGAQVMNQMLQTFRQTMPNVPADFWPELQKELNPNELVERVIPVYDKQLNGGEIKDLIKFYETTTGKKLIKVMPAITQESMEIGKAWGRDIGEKVMKKLQQKGLDKK